MARMNNMGDIGSPWRKPLSCLSGFPGSPFSMTLEEEVERTRLIQSLHLGPNPSLCRILRRYTQEMESNDLTISSFRNKVEVFSL
jgi:hypothetical protein